MGNNKRAHHNNRRPKTSGRGGRASTPFAPIVPPEKKAPVVYGKPFIVLEDVQKNTFVFKASQWTPHTMTIAECRQDCQVKQLPQKINGMTRYEVCSPVSGTGSLSD